MDESAQVRDRLAHLEAALARVEGERDEARRQVAELTRALAGAAAVDSEAEAAKARLAARRETDREYQANKRAARVGRNRTTSDDAPRGGGSSNSELAVVDGEPESVGRNRTTPEDESIPSSSSPARRQKSSDEHPELRKWWLWSQDQRRAAGAGVPEPFPKGVGPRSFAEWFASVVDEVGVDALCEAFRLYTLDQDFARRGWPVAIFRTPGVWRQRVPRDLVDEHRAQFLEQQQHPTAQQEEQQP